MAAWATKQVLGTALRAGLDCGLGDVARWSLRVAPQPVICEFVPCRHILYERVVTRSDSRVVIERAETYRDLGTLGPRPTEQTGPAATAEDLGHVPGFGEVDQPLAALQQSKSGCRNTALGQRSRARVLTTAGAMTEVRSAERGAQLVTHRAA